MDEAVGVKVGVEVAVDDGVKVKVAVGGGVPSRMMRGASQRALS